MYQQLGESAGIKFSGGGGGGGATMARAARTDPTAAMVVASSSSALCGGSGWGGQRLWRHMMPGHLSPPHIERSKIRAGSGIVVLPPLLFAFRTLHTGQSASAYLTEFWVCPSPMVDMFWPAAGVSTITFGSPGLITAAATEWSCRLRSTRTQRRCRTCSMHHWYKCLTTLCLQLLLSVSGCCHYIVYYIVTAA